MYKYKYLFIFKFTVYIPYHTILYLGTLGTGTVPTIPVPTGTVHLRQSQFKPICDTTGTTGRKI